MGLFKGGSRSSALADKLREGIEPAIAGEELKGACLSTQAGMTKGRMVAIGVTEHHLVLQPMTRKWQPDGPAILLAPGQIASASANGSGGLGSRLTSLLMDDAQITLRLKTIDGQSWKLMMMSGSGLFGGLGGGETQKQGVEALAAWFAAADEGN